MHLLLNGLGATSPQMSASTNTDQQNFPDDLKRFINTLDAAAKEEDISISGVWLLTDADAIQSPNNRLIFLTELYLYDNQLRSLPKNLSFP